MDFKPLKQAMETHFKQMGQLYRTECPSDLMWETYLNSFPEGTNEIFRVRRQHDSSYDRQFIRSVGNLVSIDPMISLWDIQVPGYQPVLDAMAKLVKSYPIENIFLTSERVAGHESNIEAKTGLRFDHFHLIIPQRYVSQNVGTILGEKRACYDVLKRSYDELTLEALETVIELIQQKSLYRGEENLHLLQGFLEFRKVRAGEHWIWKHIDKPYAKLRNTAIGTLLTDLSNGEDLEHAVRKYEAMVAPQNYRRPTSLVTPSMVKKAKEQLEELGLTLERRAVTLDDLPIQNVIFINRDKKGESLFDVPVKEKPQGPKIGISEFLQMSHQQIELYLENAHEPRLMSLVTGDEPLFKWPNNFSWSYNGEVTDSIKQRVAKAGGSITGDLCCRLAWYNHDDLDLHMQEPKDHIYFGNKSSYAGQLDVDMNAGRGYTREPVENIFYRNKDRMTKGNYVLFVHQYYQRENTNVGFEAEIQLNGVTHHFAYPKRVVDRVPIATLNWDGKTIEIINSLPSSSIGKTLWNLPTNQYHKVNAITLSPNHWASPIGLKHYFFFLEGLKGGETRGIYNEFLRSDLEQHRKVLELVGSKVTVGPSLSGVGFTSGSVFVRSNNRSFEVCF